MEKALVNVAMGLIWYGFGALSGILYISWRLHKALKEEVDNERG